MTISDVILIPFQPRSVDLWAGGQIGALVAEARAVNDLKAMPSSMELTSMGGTMTMQSRR